MVILGSLLAGAILTPTKKPVLEMTLHSDKPIVKAAMINNADVQKQLDKLIKKKRDEKQAQTRRDKKVKDEKRRIRDLERLKNKRLVEKRAADRAAKKSRDDAKKQKKLADDAIKKSKAKQKVESDKADKLKTERLRQEKATAKAKAKRISDAKAAKEKADKKRKDKLVKEKAAREQKAREDALSKEMAQEQASLNKARQAKVMSEIQKYTSLISSEIKRHWITDQSMKGKQCILNIRLASNGLVLSVKALSGNPVVCNSARTAVLKAEQLPMSKDPQVFAKLKEINLTVQPEFD